MSGFGRTAGSVKVHLNGRILPLRRATVSVFDRGFLFGDGIYETLRAYRGCSFRMREHFARLRESARRLKMRLPLSFQAFVRGIDRVLTANGLMEAKVRVLVSRGRGEPVLGSISRCRPTVLTYASRFIPPSARDYTIGVHAVIPTVVRNDRRALDPAIKTTNLLNNLLAILEAKRCGAREAILVNSRGFVTEAAAANVFFVRRGVLLTPALEVGILAGITRELVIDLARRLGIPVREGLYGVPALLRAEELFVTASTIEVLPIARLGRRRYPLSRPYTRALQEAYRVTVKDELGI